jgi:FMN-dependent NADH-azoreductase
MTKTLLQLNTSLYSRAGQSTRLADEFVARWRAGNPGATVVVRDLAHNAVPHLTDERFQAFLTKATERTPEQHAVVAYSDTLIDEIRRADVIVMAIPMYNFSVPSTAKAWFDHIARAGVTFRYTAHGPVGLLGGKKVYIFTTRGGYYAGTANDTQTAYLRQFLNFLGLDDVEFIYAEGLAINDAARAAGLSSAREAIGQLTAPRAEALAA